MPSHTDRSEPTIAAAILAGGNALRYGGVAKGFLEAEPGISIIEKELSELGSAGVQEVIIVANDPAPYKALRLAVIPDLRTGIGPLAGIEAALSHYSGMYEATLLLPCDLPGITAREIRALTDAFVVNSASVVAAVTAESGARTSGSFLWHPLCAVVHNDLYCTVSRAIDDGQRRPRALWQEVGAMPVHFDDPTAFFNVNSPEDLARWRAIREGAA